MEIGHIVNRIVEVTNHAASRGMMGCKPVSFDEAFGLLAEVETILGTAEAEAAAAGIAVDKKQLALNAGHRLYKEAEALPMGHPMQGLKIHLSMALAAWLDA